MSLRELFSYFGGALFLISFVPYIHAIIRGTTRPCKATWIIWGILDVITLLGMYAEGALNVQIVSTTCCALIVATLSMKYGISGWSKLDISCIIGSLFGLLLWWYFNSAMIGIMVSLLVGAIGSFSTFASAWHDPTIEDRSAWTIYWFSCVSALLAIPTWTVQDVAAPLVYLWIESVMMYILWFRPLKQAVA